jgi:hypothetical protein
MKKGRVKNEGYLQFLREQNCSLCGKPPRPFNQPHHCGDGILARRHRDDLAIPVCPECHILVHFKAVSREELTPLALKYRGIYEHELLGRRNQLSSTEIENSLQNAGNTKEEK